MGRGIGRRVARRMVRLTRRRAPVILMYHRIAEETFDPWALAVSPSRFDEQLDWLKRHRRVLSLAEFSELHAKGGLPANAAAITFDDGYACNAGVAAGLIDKYCASATVFLATDAIRSGKEFWWDELERLVLTTEADEIAIDLPKGELRVAPGGKRSDDRNWPPSAPPHTPRQRAFHQIWSALRELETEAQEAALAQLRGLAETTAPRDSHRPMTLEEVRILQERGIELGAHSLSHASLPARSTAEKEKEIFGSRDECAAIAGRQPVSFAYPFGDYDDESARLIEAAGFRCACTTVESAVGRTSDRFALPRVQVGNWTADGLSRALARL